MPCLKDYTVLNIRNDWLPNYVYLPRIIVYIFLLTIGNHKVLSQRARHTGSSLPSFKNTPANLTYSEGDLAVLLCSIMNLGSRKVVWRKASHPNPLTVGEMTYVADDRFQIHHIGTKGQWNLFIKNVQHADAGMYECQVSSKEKYIRKLIRVNVIDRSLGGKGIQIIGERRVEKGETIMLACNATGGSTAPQSLDWLKDGEKLVSDKLGRVNITIHISYHIPMSIHSNLTIKPATSADTGTYVCRTSDEMIRNTTVSVTDVGKDKRTAVSDPEPSSATSGTGCRLRAFYFTNICAHRTFVLHKSHCFTLISIVLTMVHVLK